MPPCCQSPAHIQHWPAWVHAVIAIAVVIAVVYVASVCWAWMSTPYVRHACGRCVKEACQFCIDEERDRRVNEYCTQMQERSERRG